MKEDVRLYRILFISSICLLLLNDLYLKYTYHNGFTGKLSDFAGLFAFPFFWSCIFPKKIKTIYISTAILFVYWKSEMSQPVFAIIQSFGVPIDRTVDYSDLVSLSILPFSYWYWKLDIEDTITRRRTISLGIKGIAIFSFIATTLPKETHDYNLKSQYEKVVNSNMETLRSELDIYQIKDGNSYNYDFPVPEANAEIHTKVIITEVGYDQILIKLDSILLFTSIERSPKLTSDQVKRMRKLHLSDIEKIFGQELDKRLNIKQ